MDEEITELDEELLPLDVFVTYEVDVDLPLTLSVPPQDLDFPLWLDVPRYSR